MDRDQMLHAVDLLVNLSDKDQQDHYHLPMLESMNEQEKMDFILNLNGYERIGLLTCYRMCIEKLVEN